MSELPPYWELGWLLSREVANMQPLSSILPRTRFFQHNKNWKKLCTVLGKSLHHFWTTLFEAIPIWVYPSHKMEPFSLLGLVKPLQAAAAAAVTDGWTGAEHFLRHNFHQTFAKQAQVLITDGKWDTPSKNLHFLIIGTKNYFLKYFPTVEEAGILSWKAQLKSCKDSGMKEASLPVWNVKHTAGN